MEWMIDTSLYCLSLGYPADSGALIGLERELRSKPVGLKTSIVISVISCLSTAVSVESVYLYHGDADVNVTMDPLRLASQIVSGIGFLGAGVILIILAVEMLPVVLRFAGPSRL
jgi:putative Mg2+ transporter-C (MgtC) family protein